MTLEKAMAGVNLMEEGYARETAQFNAFYLLSKGIIK